MPHRLAQPPSQGLCWASKASALRPVTGCIHGDVWPQNHRRLDAPIGYLIKPLFCIFCIFSKFAA
jgi:hypothetical protein